MSEHLIAARAALADEIADAQTRIARANAALAVLGGDVVPGPLPLVRPPADDVPAPPVELPKRETLPKPAEQRPAASAPGTSKYDYDEITRVAVEAYNAGESMPLAVVKRYNTSYATAGKLLSVARERGHSIPNGRRPATPATPAAPSETRTCPECSKVVSRAGIGTHRRMAHGVTGVAVRSAPVEQPHRPAERAMFSVEDAAALIDADTDDDEQVG